MKILITENQMNEIEEYIYDDLDYLYPIDDITYGSAEEYDSETGEYYTNDNKIRFYLGDFGDVDTIFTYYTEDYWSKDIRETIGSAILIMENKNMEVYGDLWYPAFKKWFYERFKLPVKTIL